MTLSQYVYVAVGMDTTSQIRNCKSTVLSQADMLLLQLELRPGIVFEGRDVTRGVLLPEAETKQCSV